MKIQVLGSGCAKCQKVYKNAQKAIKEKGIECELEKVTDMSEIIEFGVMFTPALAVDGEVKISGKVPSSDDIKSLIS